MSDYSLNETASRAKLAAKGAGYSWGMAEEIARAVFWLAERKLPGPEMLLKLLLNFSTAESVKLAIPSIKDSRFIVKDEWLCPVATGCALSDMDIAVADKTPIALPNVKCPILLLPFVADIAQMTSSAFALDFNNNTVSTDGKHVQFSSADITTVEHAELVVFRTAAQTNSEFAIADRENKDYRVVIAEPVWAALGNYAHQTYAPSTQSSRATGAGAGLNDND